MKSSEAMILTVMDYAILAIAQRSLRNSSLNCIEKPEKFIHQGKFEPTLMTSSQHQWLHSSE